MESRFEKSIQDATDNHKILIEARKSAHLTGVIDVKSFDENEIVIDTKLGMLLVQGNDLHVKKLTLEKGETDIEGRIDRLIYSDKRGTNGDARSMLARIFR